ncbi:hypothetical protein [Flocculibacter collagenilyticus]|uniref:hypothetical protein n=1 Tax=Flocculibacter collagenilyticus TaxID=2744479 RepID=UPI0018F78330|nr:hypothetical protein [Flocculibacter collagenilyticus]
MKLFYRFILSSFCALSLAGNAADLYLLDEVENKVSTITVLSIEHCQNTVKELLAYQHSSCEEVQSLCTQAPKAQLELTTQWKSPFIFSKQVMIAINCEAFGV